MKFAAGYLLGAATVIGMGASFIGGVFAHAWMMEAKQETTENIAKQAQNVTVLDLVGRGRNRGSK